MIEKRVGFNAIIDEPRASPIELPMKCIGHNERKEHRRQERRSDPDQTKRHLFRKGIFI